MASDIRARLSHLARSGSTPAIAVLLSCLQRSKFGLEVGLTTLPTHRAQSHISIAANSECFDRMSCPIYGRGITLCFKAVDGGDLSRSIQRPIGRSFIDRTDLTFDDLGRREVINARSKY
jgi:hypothetical protein